MRLLNSDTMAFEEFDGRLPAYCILSHRWSKREDPIYTPEISYQDFLKIDDHSGPRFEKIRQCCALARKRNIEWVWIDTCCIDKKSSAELSEAVNSMNRWYANSQECYVYLSDFRKGESRNSFQNSDWFDRGWTLQELLAPTEVCILAANLCNEFRSSHACLSRRFNSLHYYHSRSKKL